jgi:hypothetical protein
MQPNQHFFLSFASSLFGAALLALVSYLNQNWMESKEVPSAVVTMSTFIGGYYLCRWVFSTFIPVKCPRGCGAKAHPMPGRADRFRCDCCGDTF